VNRGDARGPRELESYLSRLEAELARVPVPDRQEILLETRSHVMERMRRAPSTSVDDVLSELGPPEAYARPFLPEAPTPSHRPGALAGIARLATGGWPTAPLLCIVAFAYSVAVLWVLIAVTKLTDPSDTGLWIDPASGRIRSFGVGMSEANRRGREVLGYWLVPIALLIAYAIHRGVAALLRRLLRDEGRSCPSLAAVARAEGQPLRPQ
jgi:hypothetical protein